MKARVVDIGDSLLGVVEEVPQVEGEMARYNDLVQRMDTALCELEQRLCCVLLQDSGKEPAEEAGPLVPLAADLRDRNDVLESLVVRVAGIIERLEL
jgi:hypothetical protein